jgi:transcriptional regulator with XRE-family HTH domain
MRHAARRNLPGRDQKDLATRAGVSQAQVSRILAGLHYPAVDTLQALASVYSLHAYQLLVPMLDPEAPAEL